MPTKFRGGLWCALISQPQKRWTKFSPLQVYHWYRFNEELCVWPGRRERFYQGWGERCPHEFIEERNADDAATAADNVNPPENFDPSKWIAWHLKLCNYLKSKRGFSSIPLFYIIHDRQPTPEELALMNDNQQCIYQAPFDGPYYWKDTGSVWQILMDLLSDTTAWEWIWASDTNNPNGRLVMQSLCQHYDGSEYP